MVRERPVLSISDLEAGYGDLKIVHSVNVVVHRSELLVVVGPNGAGKSTMLKAIAGLIASQGSIVLHHEDETFELVEMSPSQRTGLGIGFLPQVENVFANLTVLDNLKVGAYLRRKDLGNVLSQLFEEFPFLYGRRTQRAGTLSGGQRKMLALARTLASQPRCLLLDEPSAALSSSVADEMFLKLMELKDRGLPMLMVEQNARRALELSDYGVVLDMGRNRYEGTGSELLNDDRVVDLYLGGAAGTNRLSEDV